MIRVEPINFYLQNGQQKALITQSFQKFLNSLDFPIQIFVATDTLNLDIYLARLEEKADKYKLLFSDFKHHIQQLISSQSLLNRSFYIVVPEKVNLDIQMNVIKEALTNLNMRFAVENELKFVLSGCFRNLYEESGDDVSPRLIKNRATYLEVDNVYVRTIAVQGYPRSVEEGFLDKIITINGNILISLHIEPYSYESMMLMLNKELQKQRADLWSMEQKGMISPSLEIQFADTRSVLEILQKGKEKLFDISLYITCRASSLHELDILTNKVEAQLRAMLMHPMIPAYEQDVAFKSVMPLANNALALKRNITTKALSAFFPFTSQFLDMDESGVLFGLNRNNIPIIKDIFKLNNANGVVLASSGGGKSYFTKLMISRLLLCGVKVICIDPQQEYKELVKRFGGELITISRTSDTIINPLDLLGHEYDEKKLTLLDLFHVMLGGTSEIQKAVLDRALTAVYTARGITNDEKTWVKRPPIMGDLLHELKSMSKNATQIERETYRSLINRMEMYVSGVFSFLNRQTKLNFQNNFVCFNIGDMPAQVKPTMMFLILDYVAMKMRSDIERKILVIDEAWSLLQRAEEESYIFKIVKTCRKFNLGLLLITQDVGDLVQSAAGKALLNNSEYTLLLRQKPSIIDEVVKTFHLSAEERERLLTASTGEGILIIANEHSEIKIIASPEEHVYITTNADEKLAARAIVTEFKDSDLDYSKGFFRKKEVTQEQVDELVSHGYQISSHIGLYGGRLEEYLLKPRGNESATHFFVIKVIEEYLRKYVQEVTLYETRDADIVFACGKEKVAIEVETSTQKLSRIKEKVEMLNKKYKKWFFVVTDWTDKAKYQRFGSTYVRKEVPAVIKKDFLGSNSGVLEPNKPAVEPFEVQTCGRIRRTKSRRTP